MLAVRRREDTKKGRGLELVYGEVGEMGDNELEDGEAYSGEVDNATIDPGISLSYIDDKIQDVLGQFQKSFGGGMSRESSGTRLDEYGSFLPVYQRVPSAFSRPGCQQREPVCNAPRAPFKVSGAQQTPVVPSNGSVPHRSNSASVIPPTVDVRKRNNTCVSTPTSGEFILRDDSSRRFEGNSDPKILKVRIKVGSDIVLPRSNDAIYSDMGLDYSPSLSVEDSPSGEWTLGDICATKESPMGIYQVMKKFVAVDGRILSPLPDSLLCLMEKEGAFQKECKLGSLHKFEDEALSMNNGKSYEDGQVKSVETNARSLGSKSINLKRGENSTTRMTRAYLDTETSGNREPTPPVNAQKLPASKVAGEKAEKQPCGESGKACDASRGSNKVLGLDTDFSPEFSTDESLVCSTTMENTKVGSFGNDSSHLKGKVNFRKSSTGKALQEGKSNGNKDELFDPHSMCGEIADKIYNVLNSEFGSKGSNDLTVMTVDHMKEKPSQKTSLRGPYDEKMFLAKVVEEKPTENQTSGIQLMEIPRKNIKGRSLSSKEKKKVCRAKSENSEKKRNGLKSHKSSRILTKQYQRNSLCEAEGEQMENINDPIEKVVTDIRNDSKIECENFRLSERVEKNPEISPWMANVPTSDAASAPSAHVIEENWVCCDKCQKWRLLPHGTNPDHLPEKWLCSMLSWLPGMNKCIISEEETTRALHALYQVPLPENRSNMNGPTDAAFLGKAFTDDRHQYQNHDSVLLSSPTHGKKKYTGKDTSHPIDPIQLPNSVKKKKQVFVKDRSYDGTHEVEPKRSRRSSVQHISKPADFYSGSDDGRQTETCKTLKTYSVEGEILEEDCKPFRSKSKRDFDQDGVQSSQKVKAKGTSYGSGDWNSDQDFAGKSPLTFSNGFLSKIEERSSMKLTANASLNPSRNDSKANLSGSVSKLTTDIHLSGKDQFIASDMKESDKMFSSTKKRKINLENFRVHSETVVGCGYVADDLLSIKEEISESNPRNEKKAKISKAKGKESVKIKMGTKIDKNGRVMRILLSNVKEHMLHGIEKRNDSAEKQNGQFQCEASLKNMDCLDSSKRDLSCVLHSTVATSSSSKISSSHRSKSKFQEARGSPVESVSSSPLRISNPDAFEVKSNAVGKDAATGSFSNGGNKRRSFECAVGGGIGQSGTVRREKDSSIARCDFQKKDETPLLVENGNVVAHLNPMRNAHDDHSLSIFGENNMVVGAVSISDRYNKYPDDNIHASKNHGCDPEKLNNNIRASVSGQKKSVKGPSPRLNGNHESSKSYTGNKKLKIRDSSSEHKNLDSSKKGNISRHGAAMDSRGRSPYHEDLMDQRYIGAQRDNENRESEGKWSVECGRNSQSNFLSDENLEADSLLAKQPRGLHSRGSGAGTVAKKVGKFRLQNGCQTANFHGDEKPSAYLISVEPDKLKKKLGRGKSPFVSHSGDKQEVQLQVLQTVFSHTNAGKAVVSSISAASNDILKKAKQPKLDSQNAMNHNGLRHPIPSEIDAPSFIRRDANQSITTAFKEARDLKHTANRLKGEGLEHESTGLYFEAALKFLHVASLLESSSTESCKNGETTQSMSMYSDTAKLCEFCAHEYEKCKEMAAAALAYKCMEVAYMKVAFCKHSGASKDRNELQTTLLMITSGESPSSSASDVDNLNNHNILDKATLTKGRSSPQSISNHVLTARTRTDFVRLLNFAQDVNYAMEASRKSHDAFTHASANPEESYYGPDGITSVKRVLDFSFHDVEGLLHLVRLSMDAISEPCKSGENAVPVNR
ncbi:unnamed protein product [Spirodela intermedia]|uniref:CW-type domain-containing protein n=1 Tax=Spirodela intermedia TaxID=51605 RepID=A0A7I8KMZ6_SPIIN|nr:unnamed protein product [Spirodela intermedia]